MKLLTDATMAFSQYTVDGTFALYGHALTFTSPTSLTFTNNGTFDIGSQTLDFASVGGATFTSPGTVNGTGVIRTAGTVSLYTGWDVEPPLTVASGTTTSTGRGLRGAVTVANGAILRIAAASTLEAYGNVTVDGTLSGGDGRTLKFFGATFTNNGTVSLANVRFSRSGTQTIQGAGAWTCAGELRIEFGSIVSLANDLTFGQPFTVYGTLDIGSHTFTFAGASFNNSGAVNGTGMFRTTGIVSLYPGFAGDFNTPLTVTNGTTTAHGYLNGPLTIASGAVLHIPTGSALSAYGDITVNGILSGGGGVVALVFFGNIFTDNGTVSVPYVIFNGSAAQTIGGGSITFENLKIDNATDVTCAPSPSRARSKSKTAP